MVNIQDILKQDLHVEQIMKCAQDIIILLMYSISFPKMSNA